MEGNAYNNLTEENYASFNWEGQRLLSISNLLREIDTDKINRCSESLVDLKFERGTCVKNVKAFLRLCPNIQRLSFFDALVDEYKRFKEDKPIDHPGIVSLIIKSSTAVAKKEHWIIDFFYWRVNFENLLSFRVQKVFTGSGQKGRKPEETSAYMEKYGQSLENNIVTQFIIKNRATLREIEFGGAGLNVGEFKRLQDIQDLKKLTISSIIFSLDAAGINHFLRTPTQLSELKCSHIFEMGILGHHLDIPTIMGSIFGCIDKNSSTLTEITIYPIMIVDVPRQTLLEQNVLGMFAINCEIFSQCHSLNVLRLGLHAYRQEEDIAQPGMATMMGTRLINMHRIPNHVRELYLPVEEYSHDELESLAFHFPKFYKLTSFYFGTSQLNPLNSFLVRLPWIQSMLYLPDIQRIEFHNGRIEDPDGTRALVEMNPNGNLVTMRQNFPRFTFEISRPSHSYTKANRR